MSEREQQVAVLIAALSEAVRVLNWAGGADPEQNEQIDRAWFRGKEALKSAGVSADVLAELGR